ncbi:MAG: hypothetical protein CRU78_09960 [Candidatus Accumulibacter phosphatis]|uniref:Glyoxalase-like domain-containing protein n=1 Tax=Candidatus Accumulibacter phosphatis TaxID=327160 RepID=A0A6A7RTB2_9PROT|nr:hypothetical protein [Candidatus Accumulibacter phosphatis]
MPGPARAGALLYASNMERIASFYEKVLSMVRLTSSGERIVIESPDIQMLIHAYPPHIAHTVSLQNPPLFRQTPLRLFFTVPSIDAARTIAANLGGVVQTEKWQGPGFKVCNATDPEGNIFQVRESAL